MTRNAPPLVALSILSVLLTAAYAQPPAETVPQGKIEGPFPWKSTIFPGTERQYWLYVPAQYTGETPACVFVVQDGLRHANSWRLPTVMDNLIDKKEMPITIGIFISPGTVPATGAGLPRFNRSYEYDSMTDRYARFLLEEILPEVSKTYKLSDNPNDRAIGGASSGAICAFAAAWNRPDAFRRVLSTIGTYVSLRGADEFSSLVRKMEALPIRICLEDGSSDLNIYAGDWYIANQQMLSALTWAGYDVTHHWGEGGHSSRHAASIMPEMLRWLWRDYPEPIKPSTKGAQRRVDIVIPGEDWQLVSEGHGFCEGPAISPQGEVFFTDLRTSRIHRVSKGGEVSLFAEDTGAANGLMFGPDGRLFACANGKKQIVAYKMDGTQEVICEGVNSNDLVTVKDGFYFTDPGNQRVHFVTWAGERRLVAEDLGFANGIVLSPDRQFAYVSDTHGRVGYSLKVMPDNSLTHAEPLFHLHLTPERIRTDSDGMTVDREGRIYITTDMGLQICDPLGRVNLILAKPDHDWLSNVIFAGDNLDTLYVTCGGKVFKRRVKAKGFLPWDEPFTPTRPGL